MALTCFQIFCTLPELREQWDRSEKGKGKANGWASSLISRLFIRSGQAAMPIWSDFKVSLISLGVSLIKSSLYVVFSIVWHRVAWLLSNRVQRRKYSRWLFYPFPQCRFVHSYSKVVWHQPWFSSNFQL